MNNDEKITENKPDVPYIVYEGDMARAERHIKRLWITVIVLICIIAAMFFSFMIYESQFETVSYSQDGEGINNVNLGSQGDLYGTESASETKQERQE